MEIMGEAKRADDLKEPYIVFADKHDEQEAWEEMKERVAARRAAREAQSSGSQTLAAPAPQTPAQSAPQQAQPVQEYSQSPGVFDMSGLFPDTQSTPPTPSVVGDDTASSFGVATPPPDPGFDLQSPQVSAPLGDMDTMVGLPGMAQPQQGAEDEGLWGKAKAVGRDLRTGSYEIPAAIGGGVIDAANETLQTVYDLSSWFRNNAVGPEGFEIVGVSDGDDMSFDPDAVERFNDSGAEGNSTPRSEQIQFPTFPKHASTTANVVRGITQFVTGFAAAGPLLGSVGVGLAAAGKAGKLANVALRGGVSDFAFMDDAQSRLSGILKGTFLENDYAEWVASDADSPAGNRVKNLIEGLGLGLVAEGAFKAIKLTRDYTKFRNTEANAAKAAAAGVDDVLPTVAREDFDVLGSLDDPLIIERKVSVRASGKIDAADKSLGEFDVLDSATSPDAEGVRRLYVNFAHVNGPEDVKTILDTMVQKGAGSIDSAKRGTQSFEDIKLNAGQIDAWDAVMSRRVGEVWNAETTHAARNLWAQSGARLLDVAKLALENPIPANQFAARKMAAVHYAIQQEVLGSGAETARALAAHRIPVGSGEEMAAKVGEILALHGGKDITTSLLQRIVKLGDSGQINEMGAIASKMNTATTWEKVQEALINGMLTVPATHIVNTVSNTCILASRLVEQRVAGHINNMLGHDGATQLGEAAAMQAGVVGGLRDAFVAAWKTARTGASDYGYGKMELQHRAAITSANFGMHKDSYLGTVVDGLGAMVRSPSRVLNISDEFFKTLAYRMELHSLAHREAVKGVTMGNIKPDEMMSYMADIIANPPSSVKVSANKYAQYATFTNMPGEFGSAVQRISNIGPMKLILPFVRTPANILSYTMERTPFAPLMARVRQNIAAGGTSQRVAEAQIALGTATMVMSVDLAMNDKITGKVPTDPAEAAHWERIGKKPFSLLVGDTWYQYARFDPFGMQMGIAATIGTIMRNSDDDDDTFKTMEQIMVGAVLAVGNNVMEKSYMQGISSTLRAIAEPDRRAARWAQGLAGMVVPAAVARAARASDPYLREVTSMAEAIQNRIPGMSDGKLPPRRDLWGRPIKISSGNGWAYDFMSPVATSQYRAEAVDTEMERLGKYIAKAEAKVGFTGGGETATVDLREFPGAYSRYTELAGNGVKDTVRNMGCMDYLNAVVSGKSSESHLYSMKSDGPDGGKADFIQDTVARYRELAKLQLLKEFPQIRAKSDIAIEKKRNLRMPSQEF